MGCKKKAIRIERSAIEAYKECTLVKSVECVEKRKGPLRPTTMINRDLLQYLLKHPPQTSKKAPAPQRSAGARRG